MTDFNALRRDFPILNVRVHNRPLIYLDNAATTQMPTPVLETITRHYLQDNANVHRGVHTLSERSTAHMEQAREIVRRFLNAKSTCEVIFTSGTTDSINLLARSFQETVLRPGDRVLVSQLEHHSNFLPWQEACRRSGAVLEVIPLDERGDLDLSAFCDMLTPSTKLVAVTAVSNVLGTVTPVQTIIREAHTMGIPVLVDAAQAMRHLLMDVQALDCDFLAFSAHKVMGPAGTGILFGKEAWLDRLPPAAYGGGMVDRVDLRGSSYGDLPFKFEAGTPNYVGAIGLGAALVYLEQVGRESIARRERELLDQCVKRLCRFDQIHILGDPVERAGVVSFTVRGAHALDVAALLDGLGIAVRSGHHCVQPLLNHYGVEHALRVAPAFYNMPEEIDALASALERTLPVLNGR